MANLANHAAGTSVSVTGTVKSTNGNITKVTATVVRNQYNSTWTSCSVTPNATSYNMAGCSSKLLFSKLVPGEYTYTVKATNSAGTATWTFPFAVKAATLYKNQTSYSAAYDANWQKPIKTSGVSTASTAALNRFLSIAASQVGYQEGQYDPDTKMVWWPTTTDAGNWTKYGAVQNWGTTGDYWCATFAVWAANQAGIMVKTTAAAVKADTKPDKSNTLPLGSIPKFASTHDAADSGYHIYDNAGRFHENTVSSSSSKLAYQPKPGDIILFKENGKWVHTGIVYDYSPATMLLTTIEGNSGDQVKMNHYYLNKSYTLDPLGFCQNS